MSEEGLHIRSAQESVKETGKTETVADLKPGQFAYVLQVGGEKALHRHLLDMGITPGVKVLLQKTAPMGDPVEIHLRGYALTLRLEDAAKISITHQERSR